MNKFEGRAMPMNWVLHTNVAARIFSSAALWNLGVQACGCLMTSGKMLSSEEPLRFTRSPDRVGVLIRLVHLRDVAFQGLHVPQQYSRPGSASETKTSEKSITDMLPVDVWIVVCVQELLHQLAKIARLCHHAVQHPLQVSLRLIKTNKEMLARVCFRPMDMHACRVPRLRKLVVRSWVFKLHGRLPFRTLLHVPQT